jgi:transcriptional regulator with XRE-family HTH domain
MTPTEFKAIRKKLGKSQKALSLLLGCSNGTISNYEMGYKDIEKEVAEKMKSLL